MSRTIFQAKQGLITKAKKLFLGGFDFNRFWKWMAGEMNVTMYDACCDTTAIVPRPIRYNSTSHVAEFFNGTTWATATITPSELAALTASKALVSDSSGVVATSATTATELSYVSGVTSAIQTQINTNSTAIATKVTLVAAPGTATSAGTAGSIAYDATHIYVCVATNTWVRATLATF